jgi:acyl dehydratase
MSTTSLTINGVDGLRAHAGQPLGTSAWLTITQDAIDAFADATGDHYWIHVDPERASETPFGSTIAHGLLTLSLGPRFSDAICQIAGVDMLNYGFAKVRFPAPLPVGSRVRMHAVLRSVEDAGAAVTCTVLQTFEREGHEKPVCVAEAILRATPSV